MSNMKEETKGILTGATANDLQYFMQMQEENPSDAPKHSAQMWDRRADAWEKARMEGKKESDSDRIENTVEFLRGQGLLTADQSVADIGCGPGRFATAFARSAGKVTGFDFSENMVRYGMEYAKRQGRDNVEFKVCDFQTLDIEKEGYREAFDLVFSSMTPAIHGMAGLKKSMDMSRAYCCNITQISTNDQLLIRITKDLYGKNPPEFKMGRWFYSMFNVLFLMGYYPEVSYYHRHQEHLVFPDESYTEMLMRQLMPSEEWNKENEQRIWKWLQDHMNSDGAVEEQKDTCYGRILWDVRKRDERPDYKIER